MRPFTTRKLDGPLTLMLMAANYTLRSPADVVLTVAPEALGEMREFLRDLDAHDIFLHEAEHQISARLSLGGVKICARQGAVRRIRLGSPTAPVVSGQG